MYKVDNEHILYFDGFVVFEFQENQTVFISFKTHYSNEEKVTVEVNKKLFDATWINPYTCTFYFTGIPFKNLSPNLQSGKHYALNFMSEYMTLYTSFITKSNNAKRKSCI